MSVLIACLVIVPAVLLLLLVLVPQSIADRNVHRVRTGVALTSGVQFVAAAVAALIALPSLLSGAEGISMSWPATSVVSVSLYYDGFACLMLALVSFVGFVVCRFSIRYLDGEKSQGRYFQWVGMTIGAVSLFVLSGNLAMLLVSWMLTSLGLHQLLLYYSEREAAQRAAWTKFAISRVGDALLVVAIVLAFREFGSLELVEIFAQLRAPEYVATGTCTAIAWLFMLGAVTKSAQFPVHTWLPETMETPTPVSALMHAGVVNAGGYLVIRLSPLMVTAPAALATLVIIGTITVAFAGVVMLTQTSIKRTLAYSTIAQMGFMMLQCGLGAFSAAMLHILAHSLYKAHAFLNSGNVLTEAAGMKRFHSDPNTTPTYLLLLTAFLTSATAVVTACLVFSIDLASKPGGVLLGVVLTLALTSWLRDILRTSSGRATYVGIAMTWLLALSYVTGYFLVDNVVATSVPAITDSTLLNSVATVDVVLVFGGLFGLQAMLATAGGRQILASLQVHAANGFYVDVFTRRVFSRC